VWRRGLHAFLVLGIVHIFLNEDVKWYGEKFGLWISPINMEFKLSLSGCNPAVIYGNCP
jgi:hypothetical protein